MLLLFIIVFFLTRESYFSTLDYSNTGQIGDTFGGITAPFIGVSGAILTFLAFFMQLKANETHNIQFNQQSQDRERDKHENKILYLIQQNREIAQSMTIGDKVSGPKCFARMFDEFRVSYQICDSFYKNTLDSEDLFNLAYAVFHNGVGPTSDTINNSILKNIGRLPTLFSVFNSLKGVYCNGNNNNEVDGIKFKYGSLKFDFDIIKDLEYQPFDGHTTRLGQYFRNFFHVMTYTKNVDRNLIKKDEKYELIKSLRSQLSSYEQILIYLNSLSFYGAPLKDEGFIEDYRLIKNIPLPLVEFLGDIHEKYPKIEFEWDEITKRSKNTNN